jgi:arylsulfatase A-like enzyme
MLDFLESKSVFETSYVVVTSDHGEFFERGVEGHITPLLYEPVIRVPLLISSPNQKSRQDVYSSTSSVDLVPTLVHLVGGAVPDWCEGELLPLLGGQERSDRSIFMMDAKTNPAFAPWPVASFAIRRDKYKLIFYKGYLEYDRKDKFELYDLENDPEELNDLYPENSSIAKPLQDELLTRIEAADSKYGQ